MTAHRAGGTVRVDGRPLRSIAAGGTRECFEHPDDASLCIKIGFGRRGQLQSAREQRYLALVSRLYPDDPLRHVTRGHGRVRTSCGTGWVFDRVLDDVPDARATGATGPAGAPVGRPASPTLREALDAAAYRAAPDAWRAALDDFACWARRTAVILRDLTPTNVCARTLPGGALRLVVVDGIGPRGTLPRWLPGRAYARRRNAGALALHAFDDVEGLLARCALSREGRAPTL